MPVNVSSPFLLLQRHDASDGQRTIQTMIFEPQSLRLRLALGDPPTSAKPLVPLNLAELFEHDVASVQE